MTVYDPYLHAQAEAFVCPDCGYRCICDADHVQCNGDDDVYHHPLWLDGDR